VNKNSGVSSKLTKNKTKSYYST